MNENGITFSVDVDGQDKEMVRITPEGFFVEGRLVPIADTEKHDKEVYQAFVHFLQVSKKHARGQ